MEKDNGGPNQWIIRVEIIPRLSKTHLYLAEFLAGDV